MPKHQHSHGRGAVEGETNSRSDDDAGLRRNFQPVRCRVPIVSIAKPGAEELGKLPRSNVSGSLLRNKRGIRTKFAGRSGERRTL